MGRVVAIGMDGASIDLVDELCDDGTLPCLARLRAGSARIRLRSVPHPATVCTGPSS